MSVSKLLGPKHAYQAPSSIENLRLLFQVAYLEKNGAHPHTEHHHLISQTIVMGYSKRSTPDTAVFEGAVPPWSTESQKLNLDNHEYNLQLSIHCMNNNELIHRNTLWQLNLPKKPLSDSGATVRAGSPNVPFPIELMGGDTDPTHSAPVTMLWTKDRSTTYLNWVSFSMTPAYYDKWLYTLLV